MISWLLNSSCRATIELHTEVNTINETLLQHFDEVPLFKLIAGLQVKPVNDRFRLMNNLLEVTSENVFADEPSALLEMFVIVGSDESIKGFRASTIRLARHHAYLIDAHFRENPQKRETLHDTTWEH